MNESSRIIGGQAADENSIPWQVALVWKGHSIPFCGGTILCSRFILTAAHCTLGNGITPSSIEIIAGEHDTNIVDKIDKATRHKVKAIHTHSTYVKHFETHRLYISTTAGGYDVSILELNDPIDLSASSKAGAACLPDKNDASKFKKGKTNFVVSGWGMIWGGNKPSVLHHVTLPYVPHFPTLVKRTLESNWETPFNKIPKKYLDTMLVAGTVMPKGVSACYGDSGGNIISTTYLNRP